MKIPKNPLRDFLSDHQYEALLGRGLLNERAVRNHYKRTSYRELKIKHKPWATFEQLNGEFPYITPDTIETGFKPDGQDF